MACKRLLVCGHGRAGKDTACEILEKVTGLKNAGTTSKYLCKFVAAKLGISEEEAYARRHESDDMRMLWYHTGNEIRNNDPVCLIKEALKNGEITGGIRDMQEVLGAKQTGTVDLIVWIENNRVKPDPTMKFGSKECDVVIENHWSMGEFEERLKRFAKFAGLRGEVHAN